jgi:hypothetical protein
MIQVTVHVAQPIRDEEAETGHIVIREPLPEFTGDDWKEQQVAVHRRDAKLIADVLQGTLPGGTFDQLLCELLTRTASAFRVRYPKVEEVKA